MQGTVAGRIDLIWYKNQKQLFRARTIPLEAARTNIERIRLALNRYVETILLALKAQINNPLIEDNPEAKN